MTLDRAFLEAVDALRVPVMGTERVAALLYHLVHLTRPRRVLEVGAGYTTPFIALALREVHELSRGEAARLAAKTDPYLADGRPLDDAWLSADPPLAAPAYYREPADPVFVVVDHLGSPASSAGRVRQTLREVGLDGVVTMVDGRMQDARERLPERLLPIDLAWIDAWDCLYFFDHYWSDVSADGGLLVMHYLLTHPEGAAVLEYIKATQQSRPDEIEIVSLLEPHKLSQNSLTIVRKVSGYVDPEYAQANRIDYELARRDAEEGRS